MPRGVNFYNGVGQGATNIRVVGPNPRRRAIHVSALGNTTITLNFGAPAVGSTTGFVMVFGTSHFVFTLDNVGDALKMSINITATTAQAYSIMECVDNELSPGDLKN